MKNHRSDRLLEDVLLGDEFRQADTASYRSARQALQQRGHSRRILVLSRNCALALVLLLTVVWISRIALSHTQPMRSVALPSQEEARPREKSLSDEELLAAFPPGTCALTEINGRKILVFRDNEARKRFLVN
jgi:hypothetical protein